MSLDDVKSCSVTDLKGMFGPPVRTVSVDEMNRVIAARAAEAGALAQLGQGKPAVLSSLESIDHGKVHDDEIA